MMIIIIMTTTTTTWDQNLTETGSCRAEFNPTSCLHCCGFLCFFSDWTILKWLTLSVSRSFSVMRKQPCQVSEIQKSFIISLFNIFTRVFHCFKPNPTYCWTYNRGHMLNRVQDGCCSTLMSICAREPQSVYVQPASCCIPQRTPSIYNMRW